MPPRASASTPRLVVITGLSGSGKQSALNALEDLGYFGVDNLPVALVPTFAELCRRSEGGIARAAVVVDAREPAFVAAFPAAYARLRELIGEVRLLFFEATDDVLMRRYSETRRPHPLDAAGRQTRGLRASIQSERTLLMPIRELADRVIDTSALTIYDLRRQLGEAIGAGRVTRMRVLLLSFGFKHGLPTEADLVLDVRFLKNPHYVPDLRPLTGKDAAVTDFLLADDEVVETRNRFAELLAFVVPRYARDGRSYLTIAIGCTGGKHRSVMMAEALAKEVRKLRFAVRVRHRDIAK
ncbi:MAG: RNase adapter RapZ [Chloracidobacterium sp.]|uniref:RNase adapter RapZ n=1 Tax=Chloracidobacterium validum TaxID=2821543 RepID=A0ABX8B6L6_9BACT|nr:RNase adapter RapZ [Chloracidobacterium validum]QUW02603.1 RNase adapter RapZ [Chloracidobacterium validum]